MMSNSGKTVPVFVFLIAAVAVAALCLFAFVPSGDRDAADPDSPQGSSVESGATNGAAATAPETFTTDDAARLASARLRLKDLAAETRRMELKLQGARHAALKSKPELQKRLNKSQAIKREVAALVRSLPKRKELDAEHRGNLTQQAKLRAEIQALDVKIASGRAVREKAVAEGEESSVTEDDMKAILTERRQLRKDVSELEKTVRVYYTEVKKLELQSRESHPEISARVAEAERIRREVNSEISKAVADVVAQHKAFIDEREALLKECAELDSRSKRVAMAGRASAAGPDS